MSQTVRFGFLSLVFILLSNGTVVAAEAPKPLTADTESSKSADKTNGKKKDPFALPQDLVDYRKQTREDYKAWMIEDRKIDAECKLASTAVERKQCDQKQAMSKRQLDAINGRIKDMLAKVDGWRRKARGLPPLPPPTAQMNPPPAAVLQPNSTRMNSNANNPNSVLLPSNGGGPTMPTIQY